MNDEMTLYGLANCEFLEKDVEGVIERIFDDACEVAGESDAAIAARLKWPIHIVVYRKTELPTSERIAEMALYYILEYLDEKYSDPDGPATDSTQPMQEAALAFARAIRDAYAPYAWIYEPTEEFIEVAQADALDMMGQGTGDTQ